MKHILNIFLILSIFSCKAQSIIVPIGSGQDFEKNPTYYIKDVNNEFDKFEGTWKYQNGTTEITFKLKKEEHYQAAENYNYIDLLVGEYLYIANGFEVANTLPRFDNPNISGYSHKISGRIFKHRLPSHCIDNSAVSEIKIEVSISHQTEEYTEGIVILRYVNDNGIEKLEACIYDDTTMGNIPNARIDIPDGYYEFIKQ
ncbi:DUF6705 family protein [Flavobacterium sp.]|uniref:DUF6705 family protein n=1 Tax=Flavobacterium sp. TaxID=239 RepID=UPI0035280A0D